MNTRIAVLVTAVAMQACSSVSKETYTEKRVFTYPKGSHPHIKDMYMDNKPEQPDVYVGVQPQTQVSPITDDTESLFAPVPEIPQPPTDYEAQVKQIEAENDLLLAKAYNKWLLQRQ